MFMGSSPICSDFSNMVASLQRPTTCSLAITWTEVSSQLRQSCYCWRTRSNSRKTSSFCVATTSVDKLTAFTVFTTSARIDFQFACGRSSRTCLTACLLPPWSTIKFSACTAVCPPSLSQSHSCSKLRGRQRCQRTDSYAIYCGQTQRRANLAGVRTTEVSRTRSGRRSLRASWRKMISI